MNQKTAKNINNEDIVNYFQKKLRKFANGLVAFVVSFIIYLNIFFRYKWNSYAVILNYFY